MAVSHTWDRANRLISHGGSTYAYDGLSNRISQAIGSDVFRYLVDVQPGLAVVLRSQLWDESTPESPVLEDTTHFIHAQRGIFAREDDAGDWFWTVQDALGSVRGEVDSNVAVLGVRHFEPIGNQFGLQGTVDTIFGFTGEQRDGNHQIFLRKRYYNPTIGVFNSLDPFEGSPSRPMSLNGYSWVEGNMPNLNDPTGKCVNPLVCAFLTELGASLEELANFGCIDDEALCHQIHQSLPPQINPSFLHRDCIFQCIMNYGNQNCELLRCRLECDRLFERRPLAQNSATPTRVLFFSGSDGNNTSIPGPSPEIQARVWTEAVGQHNAFQYPGAKNKQAETALSYVGNDNIAVIGYSSGSDAAVMFAYEYLQGQNNGTQTGKITDVIILGGTMTGTMIDGTDLSTNWQRVFEELLKSGTDIYVYDDDGRDASDPSWGPFNSRIQDTLTPGTYEYQKTQLAHYGRYFTRATNNNEELVRRIFTWMTNN